MGFAGDDCSFPYEICPDSLTQCFGPLAACIGARGDSERSEPPDYACDCRVSQPAIGFDATVEALAIEDCRERTTEVCEKDQMVSLYSFCTNGGSCAEMVEPGEPHPGCFCPGRYVGRHCEKRRGTGSEYRIQKPISVNVDEVSEIIVSQPNVKAGMGPWIMFLIAMLCFCVAGFLAYAALLYKRFRSVQSPPAEDGISKTEMSIHIQNGNSNISELDIN